MNICMYVYEEIRKNCGELHHKHTMRLIINDISSNDTDLLRTHIQKHISV